MRDCEFSDNKVLRSWHNNADEWVRVIDRAAIPSRKLITDRAIVEATLAHNPASVLDIGCGEGWLARRLSAEGIEVWGIDGVADLVCEAQRRGQERQHFRTLSYEALGPQAFESKFDLIVCNFSLIGERSTNAVFRNACSLLNPQGYLLVQTLHPLLSCGDENYQDGWRPGSWEGIEGDFQEAAPWYFRTVSSWVHLFIEHGLELTTLREPINPTSGKPASLILAGQFRFQP
ncbi:class I SAM-dependent methyltransferase [Microbulbifer sp. CnH-101-G]|uniref:class I SAM-dependent methyltransferase n=1 Tax=Microbulbifer sp. CnH-101-G TaxID=3243393 RepID=UPI004039370E